MRTGNFNAYEKKNSEFRRVEIKKDRENKYLALVHSESKAKAKEDFLANSSLFFANKKNLKNISLSFSRKGVKRSNYKRK
jgi:hypothetical protein